MVSASSSASRRAPGPISADAIGAASSTVNACERDPVASARSRRSTSSAADAAAAATNGSDPKPDGQPEPAQEGDWGYVPMSQWGDEFEQ